MSCQACNEDMYEEFLNEIFGAFQIGSLTFSGGSIIREMDPVAFRCGMAEEFCTCEEE